MGAIPTEAARTRTDRALAFRLSAALVGIALACLAQTAPGARAQTGPQTEQPTCTAPNEIALGQGCLPCPEYSVPNDSRSRCVCVSGTAAAGQDAYGQPDCRPCAFFQAVYDPQTALCVCPPGSGERQIEGYAIPVCEHRGERLPPALRTREYLAPAGQAYTLADQRGFSFHVVPGPDEICQFQVVDGRIAMDLSTTVDAVLPGQAVPGPTCTFRLFGGRQLASGWSFGDHLLVQPGELCASGFYTTTFNPPFPEHPAYAADIMVQNFVSLPGPGSRCLIHRWTIPTITLIGPEGATWQQAFD